MDDQNNIANSSISDKDIPSGSNNNINNNSNNNNNNNNDANTTTTDTTSPAINYYEDDKEVDEDTPLNKSLKQLSTQNTNKNKKILYTLWFVDPEWIDTQSDQLSDDEKDKENLSYQRFLLKKLINYSSFLIKIPYSLPLTLYRNIGQQTTKQNNFSPLYNFNQNQPTSKLLSSYDGSILASTRNTEITFRSSNDNFSTIQKTCNLFQNDKESQWQRLCFSPDNNILAFSSSGCKIYIFLIEKEQVLHILSPGMFGLNPKDGIADLAIRNSTCSLDPDQQCYELLILGYDMILRRFHIPTSYNSFTIHPFISKNEQLPNNYINNNSNNLNNSNSNSNSNNNNNDNNNTDNYNDQDNIINRKKKDNDENNQDDENDQSNSNNIRYNRIGLGCSPNGLTIPNFKQHHHSVSCMHFSPKNNILAIGGNRKSEKSTNRGSRIKAYVSFWKISDSEPYFLLLNPPSSNENKKDLNNSTDTTYSKPPTPPTSLNEEDENFENLSKTQKIWRKIKYTLFGNYFKNVILHKVIFSNDGKQLLALDLNGTISLWKVPNENILDDTDSEDEDEDFDKPVLESPPKTKKKSNYNNNNNSSYYKPTKIWTSKDLRPIWNNSEEPSFMQQYSNNDNYNQYPFTSSDSTYQSGSSSSSTTTTATTNATTNDSSTAKINNNIIENLKTVIDISWWSDNQIIIGNKGGQFAIFSMTDNSNCLLHDPELVSTAQPLILTNAYNGRFFILETSYTSPIVEKVNLLSNFSVQDLYKSKVKIPIIKTYKYLLRYFNGGDVTDDNDEDPFHFNISREPSNKQRRSNNNLQKNSSKLKSIFSKNRTFSTNYRNNKRQLQNNNNSNIDEPVHLIRRIIRFQSTTPEQLFKTKVSQKEYNNALLIAEHYGLDKDLVHQKRWIKSLVSDESIKQYLSKVQDINWVLWSCHIRIPLKLESTILLLEFAFSKTSELIDSQQSLDHLKDHQYIILHRLIILNYLNRLKTYQEIYQNDFYANEFLRFRDCSLISAAMEYANLEDVKAVSVLFSYYSDQILPYRLDILSMIPETTSPEIYKQLLPDELNVWNPKKPLQQDWCQSKEIFEKVLQLDYNQRLNSTYLKRALLSLVDKEYEDIRSARDKNINLYPNNDIDLYSIDYQEADQNNQYYYSNLPIPISGGSQNIANIVQEWYKKRSKEIDRKSGQILNSLNLINIAIKEKNVSNLLDIQRDLEELNYIVYDNNSTNNDFELSLETYQSLNSLDKIKLLLSDSNDSNIYKLVKKRCIKLLQVHPNLLITYFENYSKDNNNLNSVKSFLLNYQKEQFINFEQQQQQQVSGQDGTFNIDIIVLLKIGLNSIFNIKRNINENTINSMLNIIEILPERGSFQDNLEDETQRLHDKKHQFNLYIQTMKILIKYQIEKPISFFTLIDKSNQQDEIMSILTNIFKFAKKNHFKQSNWRSTLDDCLAIKRLSFSSTDDTQLYCLFVKNLLSESLFFLANEYLLNCGSPDKIESLVLTASKEFFNSSSSYGHTKNLEEARSCLELIRPPTRKILREINLIKAMDILYSTFSFNKLPVEVRLVLEKGLKSNSINSPDNQAASTIISSKTSSIIYEQKEKDTSTTSSSSSSPLSLSNTIVDINDYSKQGRFELIQILLNNIKDSYLNIETILQISDLISDWNSGDLSDSGSEYSNVNDKVIVLVILAKFSMEVKKNYNVTFKICQRLIKEKEKENIPSTFNDIWKICSSLALCQNFNDIKAKQSLLSFSLLYCDSDSILILLQTLEELQFIDNLNNCSYNNNNNNNDDINNSNEIIKTLQQQKDQIIKEKDQINLEPPFIESKESILKLFELSPSSSYQDNQDLKEKENLLLINQNLLYYYQLLNYNDNNNNFISYSEIETILLELSKLTFQNGDMKSSLSYLLYLNYNDDRNFKISSDFFNGLIEKTKLNDRFQSSQERCTKLACYFYSLKLLLLLSELTKLQLFSNSIESIITMAKDLIKDDNLGSKLEEEDSQINKIKSLLLYYYNLMVDSIQEKELAEINTFIDFTRFKQDSNYKIDTIYSFAKSNQVKSLNTSISMAKRYNITPYQVLLKHIEWQLLENTSTPVFILSSQDIDELKNRQHFNNTIQKLQEYYNQIKGNQYDKLLYYFDLLPLIKDQSHSNKLEKKLLNFLLKNSNSQNSIPNSPISPISKSSSNIPLIQNSSNNISNLLNSLDFKLLLDPNYNPINQEIKSNITPDNISFFNKLISILQEIRVDDIIHTISLEKIYYYMIENLISKDINNEKSKGSLVCSIISRYRKNLDELDLQQLLISLTISNYSNLLSIENRIQIYQNDKDQQQQQQQSLVDFSFNQNDLLLSIEDHLLTVKQLENIKDLIGGKEFIKSYDNLISNKLLNYYNTTHQKESEEEVEEEQIKEDIVSIIDDEKERNAKSILNNLLNQLSTPTIIKSVYISFYTKLNNFKANSNVINYYLEFINQLLIQKPDNILNILKSLCEQSIKDKSLDSNNNNNAKEFTSLKFSILNNLRNYCYNQEKSVEFKMNIFDMLIKLEMYSVNEENEKQLDLQFIKQHKTQSIIKDIWKDTGINNSIFDIEITDSLSAIPLFDELLEHSKSIQQLIELSKLLILWNNNQESSQEQQQQIENNDNSNDNQISILNECWFKLFKKIIQDFSSNSNEIINILISIRTDQVNKFLMNINQEQELLKLLQISKFPLTTLFKFSLLSNYNIIKQFTIDTINNNSVIIKENNNNNNSLYQFNYYYDSKIKPNYLEKDSVLYKIIKLECKDNDTTSGITVQDINSENQFTINQDELDSKETSIKYLLTSENYIKEIANDQQLLHLIYSNGLISNFISIEQLFKPLFNMLLQFNLLNRNKIDSQSIFTSLQYTASMLTIQKNYYHACLIALFWWRIDYLPIQTLENSLILLEKFLNNSIQLIDQQKLTLNSNNWSICKEKIILALNNLVQLNNDNNNNDSDDSNKDM